MLFEKLLAVLSGKKTSIATILGAIIVYLLARNIIASDTAQLFSVILMALGFGANIQDARITSANEQK